MLDSCPKPKSCGTENPLWTDDQMPSKVHQDKLIEAHKVVPTSCVRRTIKLWVVRCSHMRNDFIYFFIPEASGLDYYTNCGIGFCGMN